jgi:hypothetical protein
MFLKNRTQAKHNPLLRKLSKPSYRNILRIETLVLYIRMEILNVHIPYKFLKTRIERGVAVQLPLSYLGLIA